MTLPLWSFRPSALHQSDYANVPSSRQLMQLYMNDNTRAWNEGVGIPPRDSSLLRIAQWNTYAFSHVTPSDKRTFTGIAETLFQTDADVFILNEYHWGSKSPLHCQFENQLRDRGYEVYVGTAFASTMIATKLHVDHFNEVRLDEERSAVILRVESAPGEEKVWVVGTHLNDFNGRARNREMAALLQELPAEANERVLIVGDLNQQRQQDYQQDEWQRICENMTKRSAPRDDGVSFLLQKEGFSSIFDRTPPKCNWQFSMKPPSTHWTGTIVDYAYGRNMIAEGVYISPAYWSDHRMVVSDWAIGMAQIHACISKSRFGQMHRIG
jgi:endonuclease/exonuclease/phosphatase family metal-dependent hydrolase